MAAPSESTTVPLIVPLVCAHSAWQSSTTGPAGSRCEDYNPITTAVTRCFQCSFDCAAEPLEVTFTVISRRCKQLAVVGGCPQDVSAGCAEKLTFDARSKGWPYTTAEAWGSNVTLPGPRY